MFKKMLLFGLLLVIFAGSLFANGVDCEEKVEKSKEEKQEMAERIKIAYFVKLDSLIANNKLIESVVKSDLGIMKAFETDPRQIIIFYKYMRYGDPAIQKRGIERIQNWYGNPKEVEKFKQDSIFVNYKPKVIKLLYDFLDNEYPAFQVASAFSLVSMGLSDIVIVKKLRIYANRVNIDNWNLEYTTPYIEMNYAKKYYGLNYANSELLQFKRQAIEELIRNAKKGLEMIEKRQKEASPKK